MAFQLYKTRLKCLFRNKENIFWSYVFPMALVTLFYFAFNNLFSSSDIKTINIAYVHSQTEQAPTEHAQTEHTQTMQDNQIENNMDALKNVLKSAKMSNGLPLFNVNYTDIDEAGRALGRMKSRHISLVALAPAYM